MKIEKLNLFGKDKKESPKKLVFTASWNRFNNTWREHDVAQPDVWDKVVQLGDTGLFFAQDEINPGRCQVYRGEWQ